MEIMFQTIGKCNLNCYFCAYNFLDKDQLDKINKMYMSLDTFKEYAKKCIDFGFDEFQLTPIIGEPLLDPTFLEKIEYLHTFKSLKRVSFFTNFININEPKLKRLLFDFPKLTMTISVYGLDKETYEETTGVDIFERFITNIGTLAKLYKPTSIPLEFFIRCCWHGFDNTLKAMITILSRAMPFNSEYYKRNNLAFLNWNGNWCGLVSDNTFPNQRKEHNRGGICWYSLIDNSIDPEGNISLCGACDIEKKTIIGNINRQSLEEIYSEDGLYANCYIKQQHNNIYNGCCEKCSEHHIPDQKSLKEYSRRYKWLKNILE